MPSNVFDIRNDKTYDIKKMNHRHKEIVRRLLLGEKDVHIARDLGVTVQMVRYTKTSPIVQEQLGIMHGALDGKTVDIAKEIQDKAPIALKVLEEIMTDRDAKEGVRARIAENWLDRAGFAPVKQIQSVDVTFTSDDIQAIKKRALSRYANGQQNGTTEAQGEERRDEQEAERAKRVEPGNSADGEGRYSGEWR